MKGWAVSVEQVTCHRHAFDLLVDPLGVLGEPAFDPFGVVNDRIAYPYGIALQRASEPDAQAVPDVVADGFRIDQAAIGDGRQWAATHHAQTTCEGEGLAVLLRLGKYPAQDVEFLVEGRIGIGQLVDFLQ